MLEIEPDWRQLPADTPQHLRRLLERCLRKDAQRRLHDIADARIEIEDTLAMPPDERNVAPVERRTPWSGVPHYAGRQRLSQQRIRRSFNPIRSSGCSMDGPS